MDKYMMQQPDTVDIREKIAEKFAKQVVARKQREERSGQLLRKDNYVDFEIGPNFYDNIADYFENFDPMNKFWIYDCVRRIKRLRELSEDKTLGVDQRQSYITRGLAFGYYMKQNYMIYYTVTSLLINNVNFLPLSHLVPLFMQMIEVLNGNVDKKITIINVFSGAGKSEAVNNVCSYEFARNIDAVILQISASDAILKTNAERIRKICSSDYFGFLFGHQLEKKDRSKLTQWAFKNSTKPYNYMGRTYRSGFLGASAGGTDNSKIKPHMQEFMDGKITLEEAMEADNIITEEDLDDVISIGGLLLLDDPQEEGEAATEYDKDFEDFKGKIISRARGTTPIIIVQQRVDYNDLSGKIMRHMKGTYVVIRVPVFDKDGMLLKDCSNPVKEYDMLKVQQRESPRIFACMYQQEPLVSNGEFFSEKDFIKYTPRDIKDVRFDRLFITCDTAITATKSSDYTVIGLWGSVGSGLSSQLYLLDMVRGKWAGSALFDICKETWYDWSKKYKEHIPYYVEYITSGILVYDVLEEARIPVKKIDRSKLFNSGDKIKPPKGKGDRVARIRRHYERNKIFILENHYNEVVQECIKFRENEKDYDHDDIVDVLTDAVAIVYNGQGKQFMDMRSINRINERLRNKWQ